MIRRFVLPLLGSGLLLAGTATGVLAKCEGPNPPAFCSEVVANIDVGTLGTYTAGTGMPGTADHFAAGVEKSVNVFVSKGEQPYDAVSVMLSFISYPDGTLVRAQAKPTAQPGQWRADVTLPADGTWRVDAYVTDRNGLTLTLPIDTLQVWKAPAAPPSGGTPTTPAPPIAPTRPALPIALLVAGLAAAGMVAARLRDRARRRPRELLGGNAAGAIGVVEASSTHQGMSR